MAITRSIKTKKMSGYRISHPPFRTISIICTSPVAKGGKVKAAIILGPYHNYALSMKWVFRYSQAASRLGKIFVQYLTIHGLQSLNERGEKATTNFPRFWLA
jgi:hypothetical protein